MANIVNWQLTLTKTEASGILKKIPRRHTCSFLHKLVTRVGSRVYTIYFNIVNLWEPQHILIYKL